MISIREVARLAGVSPATVSRVMNGTARVDEEKKRRVERVIEETGFKPNEAARTLFRKSARTIGVIVPNIDNPFFNEMAKAIEEEAYRRDYRITLCNSNNDFEKEWKNIELLKSMNADGIILLSNEEEIFHKAKQLKIPLVVMDREVANSPEVVYIEADHYKGGRLALEYLVRCGCRHIVHMRGPQRLSSGRKRFEGYLDACKEYGIEPCYIDCEYEYEDGLKKAEEILTRYPQTDGVMAANDMVALSVYKVFQKHGIQIPGDIQLIGFDNIHLSSIMTPELTTVEQPIAEMGKTATESLIDYIEQKTTGRNHIFNVQIIARETTRERGGRK